MISVGQTKVKSSGGQLLGLGVVSWETLLGVGDVQTAIDGALHSGENLGSGGGPGQANIQAAPESSRSVVLVLLAEVLAIDIGGALIDLVQVKLVENPPGEEEPGAVGGGIVGQANLDAIPGELVSVGSADDVISLEPGVSDLAADVGVGEPHDHPVLGGVVLVLVLDHQPLPGIEVGLALAPPPEFDLKPLEVGLVLN